MANEPSIDRFRAESPNIPGVVEARHTPKSGTFGLLAAGLLVALMVLGLAVHWASSRKRPENVKAAAPLKIDEPTQQSNPATAPAVEAHADQVIATVEEMARPWASKEFGYRDVFSGETTQALLVRLPRASATQASGYWAFAIHVAYGNCKLEYLTDLSRLRDDYGYLEAKHPMVGDPCSRSVFDPLKLSILPGNVWVRGGIVRGMDVRPPLGIEVIIKGQDIVARRME
jgi:hypothetical protein